MSIYWSQFSWEAFATLTTGVLAVAAAWWVGRNQINIQYRQIKLIENDLKIQLLEKRTDCVNDMREIYHAWMQNAKLTRDEMFKFHKLLERAELLFPPKVSKKLDGAVTAAFWAERHLHRAFDIDVSQDETKAHEKLEMAWTEEDKVMKLMPELLNELVEYTRVDAWE